MRVAHPKPVGQRGLICFPAGAFPRLHVRQHTRSLWRGHVERGSRLPLHTSVLSDVVLQEAARTVGTEETFNWYKQWYPIVPLDCLDPRKPYPFHLLGIPMVAWSSKKDEWTSFEDRCPHRLAPLSEGRIEPSTGDLMCSYHGWTFNEAGSCTNIPQIGDNKAKATACGSSRSCVKRYPTRKLHNLLWVWPTSGPEAYVEAYAVMPSSAITQNVPDSQNEQDAGLTYLPDSDFRPWFFRDFPLGYDTLLENVLDPSHVPFSHHGVQGNRNTVKGANMSLKGEVEVTGFTGGMRNEGSPVELSMTFKAPCLTRYGAYFWVYTVPTKPGWSRLLAGWPRDIPRFPRMPALVHSLMTFAGNKVPWLDHVFIRNEVLDGDSYFLHIQERLVKSRAEDWKQYYMPWNTDEGVRAMRKWLGQHGRDMPACVPSSGDLPPQMTKREVLDRYHQHTEQCVHCRTVFQRVGALLNVCHAVALIAAGASVALVIMKGLTGAVIGLGVVAILAAALGTMLDKLKQRFIFTGYDHTARD